MVPNNKMKKYPRLLQIDSRGQIVIPKDVRAELGIDEGTGFFAYAIEGEGILLKMVPAKELSENTEMIDEIRKKARQIGLDRKNLDKSMKKYKKKKSGRFEVI